MTARTQLSVELMARVGAFEAGMRRAGNSAASAADRIKGTLSRVGPSLAGPLAAVSAGITAGAAAATVAVKKAIDQADQLSKLSQKIGISTEALSGLNVAAQLSDVSLQQLQTGITRLARAQEDVASGTGPLVGVFRALDVDVAKADKSLRATDEVLRDLADVFQALPDGAEKTALAVQIFGRAGADLIPMLNAGSVGLRDFDALAERLGVRLSRETGLAAEAFNDNLTVMKIALQGVATQVAAELLPDLVNLTNGFTASDTRAKELAQSIRDIASAIVATVDFAADATNVFRGLWGATQQLGNTFQAVGSLTNPLGGLAPLWGGETPIEAARRNLTEGAAASARGMAAFGRVGDGLSGATLPPPVEFITPDTLPPAKARDGDAILAELKKLREEDEKRRAAAAATAAANRDAAAAERDRAKALAEADRAPDLLRQGQAEFMVTLEDYRAQLAGPLAEAELAWDRRQRQLREQAKLYQISAADLADGLGLLAEARRREVDAINAQLSPAQQVIADLDAELRLMKMSNVEREIANALRFAGADATAAERAEIVKNMRAIDEARQRLQFDDSIRRGFEDTFASIIDGSKSAREALQSLGGFITQLIAQRLSTQLVDSLFGPVGPALGTGGSGIGNFLGRALGTLFGGGRAAGGWVAPGKFYEVAENGPELLRMGNRQFLLPTATGGMVTPNSRLGGGGGVVQHISVQGSMTQRTAAQLAQEAARAQNRARARLGA